MLQNEIGFLGRLWLAVKRWFSYTTTEENLYLMLNELIGPDERAELVNVVVIVVESLMSSPLDGEKKFAAAKTMIHDRLVQAGNQIHLKVKQWIINAMIELAVAKLKIDSASIDYKQTGNT